MSDVLEEQPARTDKAAVVAIILGVTAFAVAQGLTYPLITLVLQERGETDARIGLNALFYAAGFAASTIGVNRALSVIRGDILIILGLFGCAASVLALGIINDFWMWCLLRLSLGICASTVFIISEAWLGAACSDDVRGRMSGLYGAGLCGGFAVGPLAIPLFGTNSGISFAVTAIYVAAIAFASALLARNAKTLPVAGKRNGMFQFVKGSPMLVGMVLAFGLADIAAISAMPAYLVHSGFSQSFAAVAVTVVALPTALSQPVIGALLDRMNRSLIGLLAAAATSVSFLLIPWLDSGLALLVAFGFIGCSSFALYTCALTLLGERHSGSSLVTGSAAFSLSYAAGSALGSSTTGMVMTLYSPDAGPLFVAIALGAFAVVYACTEVCRS
jgi:MFS family permease